MNRIWIVALATMIAGCSGAHDIAAPFNPPVKQPDTPAVRTPDPVTFDRTKFLVLTGENLDLGARATNPSGATLVWKSSNPSAATVSNGIVTGTSTSLDTVTVSVTPSGGTTTEVKLWVIKPLSALSWSGNTWGCPTQAETDFVTTANPNLDLTEDASGPCEPGLGTVPMSKIKAHTVRVWAAAAGTFSGPVAWAPSSRNLFEWAMFDAKLLGMQFTTSINSSGACCKPGWNQSVGGVIQLNPTKPPLSNQTFDGTVALGYLSLMVHEIRHIIYGAHMCYGQFSPNDQNVAQQGPFGAEYELFSMAARNGIFAQNEQRTAQTVASGMLTNNFCDKP